MLGHSSELLLPVRHLPQKNLSLKPLGLPQRVVHILGRHLLERRFLPLRISGVKQRHLLQEHSHRPLVHNNMVNEWSMGVFLQEMALLYSAYAQGQESPFKEMPTQYVDYTLWQTQWFQGEVFLRQMSYWKQQLAGMPEHLELEIGRA